MNGESLTNDHFIKDVTLEKIEIFCNGKKKIMIKLQMVTHKA